MPKTRTSGQGRRKGSVNKTTKSAREAFMFAADGLGGGAGLLKWGEANPNLFWPLYARLIPHEVVGPGGDGPLQTVVKHIYEGKTNEPA